MMLVTSVTVVLGMLGQSLGHDPPPTSTVRDDHKYYTLEVYQNNQHKSFDDNFIDMENAEVKSGKSRHYYGVLESVLLEHYCSRKVGSV